MGKWTYRITFLLCLVLIVGLIAGYYMFLAPKSEGEGEEEGIPTAGNPEGWLIYPDKKELILNGTVTIRWNQSKVETDMVIIEWTAREKCAPDMASEACWQLWVFVKPEKIAEAPNTGEYQWDTTQYPNGDYNHIRIRDPAGDHYDSSDYPFAIQN